ncbi:MAG: cytochrome c [Chitinophagaceae bacterium]|nr:cytochrome c [Chitinophagaceae bacterium]
MAKKLLYAGIIATAIVWISACSKDSEDEFTTSQCNTDNMKYSTDILPIIQTNCYGCHGNGIVTNGIDLDGYTKMKVQADNGNLVGVVSHANGYPPMPQDAAKLSDCDINKIKSWVQNGALNN